MCINTLGSYRCDCGRGFYSDRRICKGNSEDSRKKMFKRRNKAILVKVAVPGVLPTDNDVVEFLTHYVHITKFLSWPVERPTALNEVLRLKGSPGDDYGKRFDSHYGSACQELAMGLF